MSTPEAEFKKGEPGVDEQLGQGEAQELNEGLATARDAEAEAPLPEGPMPEEAAPGEIDAVEGPEDEDEEILAEAINPRPVTMPRSVPAVPLSVLRRLPRLRQVAQSPGAPPAAVAMYRLIIQRLREEDARATRTNSE